MSFKDGQLEAFIDDAQNAVGDSQRMAQRILDEQPPMERESQFYWTAFNELGTDRPASMSGVELIPLSAIRGYCDDLEMNAIERETFKRIIMAIDNRRALLLSKRVKAQQAKSQRP